MEEILPRPTPELQLEFLKGLTQASDDMDESISDEFDVSQEQIMLGIGDRFPEFKLNAVSGNMLQKDPDWKDADHEFITVDNWSLRDLSLIHI